MSDVHDGMPFFSGKGICSQVMETQLIAVIEVVRAVLIVLVGVRALLTIMELQPIISLGDKVVHPTLVMESLMASLSCILPLAHPFSTKS